MRNEVVSQRIEDHDDDAGVGDMLDDFHEAHFERECSEEEPKPTARHTMTCWVQHKNPFMGILRFHNWMPLRA